MRSSAVFCSSSLPSSFGRFATKRRAHSWSQWRYGNALQLGTLIATLACFVFAFVLWKSASRWRKSVLVLALIVVSFSAVMARLNYFEWMFHPIPEARFLAQAQSKLDPKEMIMSVRLGDDARAYPISQMAYHHVLNDVVGDVPIAVTY